MKREISKRLYVSAGSLLITLGLAQAGYGGWLLTHLDDPVDKIALRSELTEQCKALALSEGYAVTHKGKELALSDSGLEDHEARIYRASWLVLGCEGYVMTRFCMGEECSPQGAGQIAMTLTYAIEEAMPAKPPAKPWATKQSPAK